MTEMNVKDEILDDNETFVAECIKTEIISNDSIKIEQDEIITELSGITGILSQIDYNEETNYENNTLNWDKSKSSYNNYDPPIKKRKRILLLNDESDTEEEKNREEILKSISPPICCLNLDLDEFIFPSNEKPKPKSKKVCTQILKEYQARALLQNAVIIPAETKRKKKRVLDSDEDGELVDTSDIGLISNNEGDIYLPKERVLVQEINLYPDSIINFQDIETDKIEKVISFENTNILDNQEYDIEIDCEKNTMFYQDEVSDDTDENNEIMTVSDMENASLKPDNIIKNSNQARDSGNSTDSIINTTTKQKPVLLKDPFGESSSSSDEVYLPNDVYFGTPDKIPASSTHKRGRPKRRQAIKVSTSNQINSEFYNKELTSASKLFKNPNGNNNQNNRQSQKRNTNRNKPERRSYSSSSSSSSTSTATVSTDSGSEGDWKKMVQTKRKPIRKLVIHTNTRQITKKNYSNPINKHQSNIKRKKRKHDRFYDRSREIPNDVYFADVQVPLHVLHSYGGTSSQSYSESENECGNFETFNKSKRQSENQPEIRKGNISNGRQRGRGRKSSTISPSGDTIIKRMKMYLNAAGIKRVKFNKLWEGCKSNQERADKILDLLREKGLEGYPTIEKCKQLKKQILTKREIEDLDINAIIETEGRTRRSSKRKATRRFYTYDDEEEVQQTLSKLKQVVDSDSDHEHLKLQ